MFLLKPSRWRNRFLTEPANINATAGNGASCPLPSVAAMSACWTGKRPPALGDGDYSSCPRAGALPPCSITSSARASNAGEPERLRSLRVDHEAEFCRLLNQPE